MALSSTVVMGHQIKGSLGKFLGQVERSLLFLQGRPLAVCPLAIHKSRSFQIVFRAGGMNRGTFPYCLVLCVDWVKELTPHVFV